MDLSTIVADTAEKPLAGTVQRLVQQQGIDSLGPLVDDLDQLARLEALVEANKPPPPAALQPDRLCHLLLITPFRYPPLRHGSRFGSRHERGKFYGSRCRHPSHYGPTQRLGSWMRDGGVEAFEDLSVRSRQPLVQVGLFSPSTLCSTLFDQVDLTAEIRSDQATFLSHDGQVHAFPRQQFLVDGVLPHNSDAPAWFTERVGTREVVHGTSKKGVRHPIHALTSDNT
jgi:hypothetical protein